MKKLIVGLGNPGKGYVKTRHNIGQRVITTFAKQNGQTFRPVHSGLGEVARLTAGDDTVILLFPLTYMNSSGEAVRRCVDEWSLPLGQILVVADDIDLPFGRMRMREQGSSGGHNGLKSIEEHLGTREYPRLKIGIGDREEGDLTDHVLGMFTPEQEEMLPEVVERAIAVLNIWLTQGIYKAMPVANSIVSDSKEKDGKTE
jgi:PTH1 family peptidyl-tRNA hydrolase